MLAGGPVAALVCLSTDLIAMRTFAWGTIVLSPRFSIIVAAVVVLVTVMFGRGRCIAVVIGVFVSALGCP